MTTTTTATAATTTAEKKMATLVSKFEKVQSGDILATVKPEKLTIANIQSAIESGAIKLAPSEKNYNAFHQSNRYVTPEGVVYSVVLSINIDSASVNVAKTHAQNQALVKQLEEQKQLLSMFDGVDMSELKKLLAQAQKKA